MSSQPWLSVLMPTYNGARYLDSALQSIAEQADPDIECVIVDDGSTDNTLTIVKAYEQRLRIHCKQTKRSGNWVGNTNLALMAASGQYACFLHQDDLWLSGRLSILRRLAKRYPDVLLFLGSAYFVDENSKRLGLWSCPLAPVPTLNSANECQQRLLVQNFVPIPAPIFRRDAADRVGGLDESAWYAADWDFWLKLAALQAVAYYPQPLVEFRIHGDSQTIVRSSLRDEFNQQLETVLQRHLSVWEAPHRRRDRIKRVSYFSVQVNTTLASAVHGNKKGAWQLLPSLLKLGPLGIFEYLRDSRIWERAVARIIARLG